MSGIYQQQTENDWQHFPLHLPTEDERILQVHQQSDDVYYLLTRQHVFRVLIQGDSLAIQQHCATPNHGQFSNFTLHNDTLWLTAAQAIYQYPVACYAKPTVQTPLLSSIALNGKSLPTTQNMTLPWRHSLRLHFAPLQFEFNPNKLYRYRLSTTDEWTTTTESTVNLIDVSPGYYQLDFQCNTPTGDWVSAAPVQFRVQPPWYRNPWVIALAFLAIFSIVALIIWSRLDVLKKRQRQLELEEEVNQLKHQAYQAQMNPHFIFNCLNAIQGFMMGNREDVERAINLLSRFSSLIRRALSASRQEKISLEDDLHLLRSYLDLEQMRFNHSFHYEIVIDPALEINWLFVPPLLIQPYVENAVLHGMAQKKGEGQITITLDLKTADTVEIHIIDNGPGIETQERPKTKRPAYRAAVGMQLTAQRVALLTESKGQVEIAQAPQGSGTMVRVTLPKSYLEDHPVKQS
ncbi:MAG: histidine kinase [Bacteroidota bacterium]